MTPTNWIKQPTPFIILSLLALVAVAYFLIAERGGPEGLGSKYIIIPFVTIGMMLTVDFALKRLLHLKLYLIWIIEFILLLGLVYWWIIS